MKMWSGLWKDTSQFTGKPEGQEGPILTTSTSFPTMVTRPSEVQHVLKILSPRQRSKPVSFEIGLNILSLTNQQHSPPVRMASDPKKDIKIVSSSARIAKCPVINVECSYTISDEASDDLA